MTKTKKDVDWKVIVGNKDSGIYLELAHTIFKSNDSVTFYAHPGNLSKAERIIDCFKTFMCKEILRDKETMKDGNGNKFEVIKIIIEKPPHLRR